MEKCIAFLLHEGYEDLEFWVPRYICEVAGCRIKTLGMRDGRLCEGAHGLKAPIEANVSQVLPESIDALVIPGGQAPGPCERGGRRSALWPVTEASWACGKDPQDCHGWGSVERSLGLHESTSSGRERSAAFLFSDPWRRKSC